MRGLTGCNSFATVAPVNTKKPAKKAKESNVLEVEVKGVTVKIYPRPKPNGNGFNYQVVDYSSGKRKFISCPTEDEAKKEGKRIAGLIAAGDAKALAMTGEDRQQLVAIRCKLEPLGVDPVVAASEYATVFQMLNGRSLIHAVEDYVRRNPSQREACLLSKAIDELLEARRKDKRSGDHLRDLKVRLEVFSDAFKNYNVGDIGAEQVNTFLRGLDCGGRSRNNYRRAISSLFRFCTFEKKYIAKDHITFTRSEVPRATEDKAEIEIFTPAEVMKLIDAAWHMKAKPGVNKRYTEGQGLLPLVVLGAFAGIRTGREITRQLWSDIHRHEPKMVNGEMIYGYIQITAEKGNTAQNRLIPIQANLAKWLDVCKPTGDRCCTIARPEDAIARLAKRGGVEWKHNGLRHSYISYRVAQTQDVPKVALESGNSPKMIFKNYRKPLPATAAPEWFGITPELVTLKFPTQEIMRDAA